jgi:hypothetical protein
MKLWRITFGVDNGYSGEGYLYCRSRAEAQKEARRLVVDGGHDEAQMDGPPQIEPMEVPTDKDGLISYLNHHHSQSNT